MLDRKEILRSLFTNSIEDTIETLPYTIQVFQDPLYDLKKIVINDLDFLLGASLHKYFYFILFTVQITKISNQQLKNHSNLIMNYFRKQKNTKLLLEN